jgi:hypothetical protein
MGGLTGDDVAAAERDLADFDAVDHLLQMMPGPVKAAEAAHERRMHHPHLQVQRHQRRRSPLAAARRHPGAGPEPAEDIP